MHLNQNMTQIGDPRNLRLMHFRCGEHQETTFGYLTKHLDKELQVATRNTANHLNRKSQKHPWMATFKRLLMNGRRYDFIRNEDGVISDDDVKNSCIDIDFDGDDVVITVNLDNELYARKWFQGMIKRFIFRQYFLANF